MGETAPPQPIPVETATAPQGRPIWYELMTPDPGAVAPFYRAVLGWEIPAEGHAMPNGSEYREIRRTDGGNAGGVLTLTEQMRQSGARPGWMTYFHVDDVDAAVAKAWGPGASVHMPPSTMEGVGRMAMVTDPQGAPFYLMDPTPPADRPDAQSDVFEMLKPGHCWWNELQTTDEPAATEFYKALFGWTADQSMPMGDKGEYRFVELDGQQLGAINPWMGEGMPVSWLPYFGVADIEAARDAAKANGGTITHDVQEVPGGSFIITATDPAGAPVAFVGPKGA
jgi:predicted enzyme related to lactoylglutathione lyase